MSLLETGKPAHRNKPKQGVEVAKQLDFTDDLLSDEEKEELRLQVREDLLKERKKLQADSYYNRAMREAKAEYDPKLQVVPLFLQLPGSCDRIRLDGSIYFADTVYNDVPLPVAQVLIEQMMRAWAHEEVTEVRDRRTRRRWTPPAGLGWGNFSGDRTPRQAVMSSAEVPGAVAQMQRTVHG